MQRSRRGTTLVELIVAIVLLTLLGAAALRTMLALGRQSVAVVEHAAVQGGGRTGLVLLRTELQELGTDPVGADLLRVSRDSVTFRAPRGFGLSCAVSGTEVRILDAEPLPFSGLRAITPGRDSLLLFVEGDSATAADDHWIALPVLSVGGSSCGGAQAIAIGTTDFTGSLPSGTLADVAPGEPVRTFEVMRIAEYVSSGQRWLGLASVSAGETIQPVAGPLAGDGLTLEYLDAGGAATTDPMQVRSLRLTLVGASERRAARNWTGGPSAAVVETVSSRLFLRNIRR